MKALRTKPIRLPVGVVIGCLFCGGLSLADERPVIKAPLQRQLEFLVLPEVRFEDTDLMDALLYLQKKAQASPQGAVKVPFVVRLPEDFQPRYHLSLDLKTVSFWGALGHLCGQASVGFSIERGTITIRPLSAASAAKATVRTELPVPPEAAPARGLAGPLGKPAEPLVPGNNVHRALNGEIQPEKSGTGIHRNLNGWPIADDPENKTGMNCVHMSKCPGDDCGCDICGCNKAKNEKKPEPKP